MATRIFRGQLGECYLWEKPKVDNSGFEKIKQVRFSFEFRDFLSQFLADLKNSVQETAVIIEPPPDQTYDQLSDEDFFSLFVFRGDIGFFCCLKINKEESQVDCLSVSSQFADFVSRFICEHRFGGDAVNKSIRMFFISPADLFGPKERFEFFRFLAENKRFSPDCQKPSIKKDNKVKHCLECSFLFMAATVENSRVKTFCYCVEARDKINEIDAKSGLSPKLKRVKLAGCPNGEKKNLGIIEKEILATMQIKEMLNKT